MSSLICELNFFLKQKNSFSFSISSHSSKAPESCGIEPKTWCSKVDIKGHKTTIFGKQKLFQVAVYPSN